MSGKLGRSISVCYAGLDRFFIFSDLQIAHFLIFIALFSLFLRKKAKMIKF